MAEMVTLSLPDEVVERARETASRTGQDFQQVLSEWLQQAAKRDPATLIIPNVSYPIYTPFGNEADMRDPASSYTWEQVRQQHPNVWVLIEALDAYTDEAHGKRIIPHMRFIQAFGDDSHPALEQYKQLHHAHPEREYFFYHTIRETLDIGIIDEFGRRLDA